MELSSPSVRNSILNVPTEGWVLLSSLNVLSVSCVSVNCVVVVERKTIGPFEREPAPPPVPVDPFDGIEYDIECAVGRVVSSELMPRPMRTMISENW
jgi:hypothetical protein